MNRFFMLGALLLTLTVFGCGPSEDSKEKPATMQAAAEKAGEAAEKAAAAAKTAAEAAKETAADVATDAKQMATEASEKSVELADRAVEASKEAAAEAKETATRAADAVAEAATTAAVATTTAAGEAVKAAQQAVSPEIITFEASYGTVTFPHAVHAGAFACTSCHGEGTPAALDLDKDKAHALCRDCHKQEAAGPSDCKGCHKK